MSKLITTDQAIDSSAKVTLSFSLKLEDGQLIDQTEPGSPATLEMGDGSLLPGFEECLLGLRVGDKKSFELPPEQAFGEAQSGNLQRLPRAQFKDMDLEPGLLVSFASPEGELPGMVQAVEPAWVTVDFNHPLAGRRIVFDVQIVEVAAGARG